MKRLCPRDASRRARRFLRPVAEPGPFLGRPSGAASMARTRPAKEAVRARQGALHGFRGMARVFPRELFRTGFYADLGARPYVPASLAEEPATLPPTAAPGCPAPCASPACGPRKHGWRSRSGQTRASNGASSCRTTALERRYLERSRPVPPPDKILCPPRRGTRRLAWRRLRAPNGRARRIGIPLIFVSEGSSAECRWPVHRRGRERSRCLTRFSRGECPLFEGGPKGRCRSAHIICSIRESGAVGSCSTPSRLARAALESGSAAR